MKQWIAFAAWLVSHLAFAGGEVGNPGDALHFRFLRGKLQSINIIGNISQEKIPPETDPTVKEWLLTNLARLAIELEQSPHAWTDAIQNRCIETEPLPYAAFSLQHGHCLLETSSTESAGHLLVKGAAKHLGADENLQEAVADAAYEAWRRWGGDATYWEPMPMVNDIRLPFAFDRFWTGKELIWGLDLEVWHYSPVTGRIQLIGSTPLEAQSKSGFVNAFAHDHLFFFGGKNYVGNMLQCHNDGFLFDNVSPGWSRVSDSGAPSARSSAKITDVDQGFVVLGGLVCDENDTPLLDGGILNMQTSEWTSIPALPVTTGEQGRIMDVFANSHLIYAVHQSDRGRDPEGYSLAELQVWSYQVESREWHLVARGPQSRRHDTIDVIPVGGRYVLWGPSCYPSGNSQESYPAQCLIYDPAAATLSVMSTDGMPRTNAATYVKPVSDGEKLIVAYLGITEENSRFSRTLLYFPRSDRWTQLPIEGSPDQFFMTPTWIGEGVLTLGEKWDEPSQSFSAESKLLHLGGRSL